MVVERAAFRAEVEALEGHDGTGDGVLREAEQDAGGLCQERAIVAERAYQGGRNGVECRGGGGKLGYRGERIGQRENGLGHRRCDAFVPVTESCPFETRFRISFGLSI